MIELIGWLGGALLTFCGVPLAWQSYKQGHAHGVNMAFLQMWIWGEALVLIYVLAQPVLLYPLVANYSLNIVLIAIILYYKVRPRD